MDGDSASDTPARPNASNASNALMSQQGASEVDPLEVIVRFLSKRPSGSSLDGEEGDEAARIVSKNAILVSYPGG